MRNQAFQYFFLRGEYNTYVLYCESNKVIIDNSTLTLLCSTASHYHITDFTFYFSPCLSAPINSSEKVSPVSSHLMLVVSSVCDMSLDEALQRSLDCCSSWRWCFRCIALQVHAEGSEPVGFLLIPSGCFKVFNLPTGLR